MSCKPATREQWLVSLRRRIERATPGLVPLQSKSRVGYVFRAPLVPA
mgnify:CR=1 FL=1